ncbi:MAG: arsenate reductase ArsC [Nitrosopumilus sp.]|uniref:arsenate reductase ArsC n=1 Tax=Nitrosopumilus sp. TaxID=2024843 RepID=UPI00247EC1FD|nr:arsenate reductase ArsC [Nitrosopumilus sp.]MCV0391751.1 arsenate reductase ArsC [Nitrosopumilus sp.]
MVEPKKLLFVCVENAGRSQMAEAFLRKYAPDLQVVSAGTKPNVELNPIVVDVMSEIGIDMTNQKPKELTSQMIEESITVNMGCMDKESCPALFVKDVIDWNIPDPKGKDIAQVREIRDKIKSQVIELLDSIQDK